jgi:glycosyltransferase involved in cell wall biosynthesis
VSVPAVTVVIPTYRRSERLERAIGSVFRQTCGAWELIVVDDNGRGDPQGERTRRRMRPFLDDPRVRYLAHEGNRGGSAARNTGVRAARGDYVAFLDDDDEWREDKLARQLDTFGRVDAGVAVVCTGFVQLDEAAGTRRIVTPRLADPLVRELLMKNVVGPTSTIMCRRDALLAVEGFDEDLPSMQDLDLYVRLAARYRFAAIDEPLVLYHKHMGGRIGSNVQAVATARRAFTDKHWERIESDPGVLRHRLESDAMALFGADRPGEAAGRLAAVLRSAPHRIDLLGFYVLARFGLTAPTNRARRALGRVKRWARARLRRWAARHAVQPSAGSERAESAPAPTAGGARSAARPRHDADTKAPSSSPRSSNRST